MVSSTDSEIIRWRQHTRKSRVYGICAQVLVCLGVASTVSGIGGPLIGAVFMVGALVVNRLGRRWMTEVIRPRPKRSDDKLDMGRLMTAQFALMLVALGLLGWAGYSSASGSMGLAMTLGCIAVGMAILFVSNFFIRRAYERLFERVARREGAYGL